LVPLSLGGVLGHHRLVEPLLDIAAEAVRGQLGEVEGLYRHRCQDLHGKSAAVDLHHQRTERLIVFGAQRRQVPAGIRELPVDVGHLLQVLVGRRQVVGRVDWKALPGYWIVQVIGGLLAGLLIYLTAKGKDGFTATGNMAANGFGEHSPGGYSLWAVILAEIVLTGVFLLVILGSTDDRAPKGFAGLAIGLTLTLIHLISIPISNTSVNPARSTGVAFFNGNGAPAQLWVFWLAPLIGAAIAGLAYPYLFGRHEALADRPVRDEALEADDDSGQHRAGPP
jgi:aquaporin Z